MNTPKLLDDIKIEMFKLEFKRIICQVLIISDSS